MKKTLQQRKSLEMFSQDVVNPDLSIIMSDTDCSYTWICLLLLHFMHEGFVWMAWGEGRSSVLDFDLYLYKKDAKVLIFLKC